MFICEHEVLRQLNEQLQAQVVSLQDNSAQTEGGPEKNKSSISMLSMR